MTLSWVYANRDALEPRNYIRGPVSDRDDRRREFTANEVTKRSQQYNGAFNLILVVSKDVEDDYYVLPYPLLRPFLTTARAKNNRWMISIKDGMLRIDGEQLFCVEPLKGVRIDFTTWDLLFPDSNQFASENARAERNIRPDQRTFHNAVLANFECRCCLSGVTDQDLLIASHIVPWAEDKTVRLHPGNGLCLSALIDPLFDKGYFSFDEHYRVILSPRAKQCSQAVLETLEKLNKQEMRHPVHAPIEQTFLRYHREKWKIEQEQTEDGSV